MRFLWTEEQQLLAETLARFVTDRCVFDPRQLAPPDRKSVNWAALADMGVLAAPISCAYGGGGGSALDVALIMEAFGRGLVREPFLSSIVLGAGLLQSTASPAAVASILPAVADGSQRLAVAHAEAHSRFNLAHAATRASTSADGYALTGHKTSVYGAPDADHLIVTARTRGPASGIDGLTLFLLRSDLSGIELRPYTTVDGFAAADVLLQNVRVGPEALLAEDHAAFDALVNAVDRAIVASCAEAVGIMAALNVRCIAHTRGRSAFGRPLADFQVIQHRIVDMHVSHEQACAIVLKAASELSSGLPSAPRTVAACKAKVAEESAFVAKAAVQLHGAMGITEELDVGHYFRRVTALQTLFGSRDHHLRRYIELGRTVAGVA